MTENRETSLYLAEGFIIGLCCKKQRKNVDADQHNRLPETLFTKN
jgi:predicted TIM-barrel enzyme